MGGIKMKQKVLRIVGLAVVFLLWLVFFFAQHVICFDVFDDNEWYFYLLAIFCALIQYTLLFFRKQALNLYGIVYACTAFFKSLQFILYVSFQGYVPVLQILCTFIDVVGAVFTLRYNRILKKMDE